MSRRSRAVAPLVVLGALVAACGGETTSDQATPGVARPPASSLAPSLHSEQPTTTVTTTTSGPATPAPTAETPATSPQTAPGPTPTTEPAAPGCRRLTRFDGDTTKWAVVDDGVMGGRSAGVVDFVDSTMRFTGNVVTAGGGFTSVRRMLDGDELVGTERIVLRVRADDRTYGLTLEDASRSGRRPVAHGADLVIEPATDADGWNTVELAYERLEPTVFGQPIDADAFDPDTASEIGIIIADGQDGGFELTVDWIDACR